jgi:hypothetical protein
VGGVDPTPLPRPLELRVLYLMRDRVPRFRWDPTRVVLAVRDFEQHIDVEEVAGRCADLMMSGQLSRMKDPEGTLRTFFERARAEARAHPEQPALAAYDRILATFEGSCETPSAAGSSTSSPGVADIA